MVTSKKNQPLTQIPPLPESGYVRLPAILARYPVSRSTWWNMVKARKAPQPIKLGPMTTAWKIQEIRAFLDAADTRLAA